MSQVTHLGRIVGSGPYVGRELTFCEGSISIEGVGQVRAPQLQGMLARHEVEWASADVESWAHAYAAADSVEHVEAESVTRRASRRSSAKSRSKPRTALLVGVTIAGVLLLAVIANATLFNPTFGAFKDMASGTSGVVVSVDPMTATVEGTSVNLMVFVEVGDEVIPCENGFPDVAPGDEVAIRQKESAAWEIVEVLSRDGRSAPPVLPERTEYEKSRETLLSEDDPDAEVAPTPDPAVSAIAMDARQPLRVLGELAQDAVVYGSMTNASSDWDSFWSKADRTERVSQAESGVEALEVLEDRAESAGATGLEDVLVRGRKSGQATVALVKAGNWSPYEKFVAKMEASADAESYRWTASYVADDWFSSSKIRQIIEERDELKLIWDKYAYSETELGRFIETGQ